MEIGWSTRLIADKEHMGEDMDRLFEDLQDKPGAEVTEVQLRNLIYCDFHDPIAEQKLYIEIEDWDALSEAVTEYLDEYNDISKTPMDLVLFRYVFNRKKSKL